MQHYLDGYHFMKVMGILIPIFWNILAFTGLLWVMRQIAIKICMFFHLDVPWLYGKQHIVNFNSPTARDFASIRGVLKIFVILFTIFLIILVYLGVVTFKNTLRLNFLADSGILEFKYKLSVVEQESARAKVDPNVIKALITWESGWNTKSVNKETHDYGAMQLHIDTARLYHPNMTDDKIIAHLFNFRENVRDGIKVYKDALSFSQGNRWKAFTAYNGGHRGAKNPICVRYANTVENLYWVYNHKSNNKLLYTREGRNFLRSNGVKLVASI